MRLISRRRIPGTHRVYNLTVEGEHVYHVTKLVVDGHNNCPHIDSDWGRNRIVMELHDQGFVLKGPSRSGGGLVYENPATGEAIRIVPRPRGPPYRTDPIAKFENDFYYRYTPGPGMGEGPHITIPNK